MTTVRGEPGGFWQSLRRLPDRTPLRIKMITAVLTLVVIALAVISIAGISVLRSYLLGQADSQLDHYAAQAPAAAVAPYLSGGSGFMGQGVVVDWVPQGGSKVQQVVRPGTGFSRQSESRAASPGPVVSATAGWVKSAGAEPLTVAATSGNGRWRVLAYPHQFADANGDLVTGTVVVGVDVTNEYATLGRLTAIDLLVSVIVIVGLAVVGVAVVRASLRPLSDIEQTAEAIAAGDLTRRVPDLDPGTEVGRLGRSLNAMLSQIETAFRAQARSETAARRSEERMRQFVADASHELRTPLTAIRGFAEYYRQRGGVDTGSRAGLESPGGGGPAGRAPLAGGTESAAGAAPPAIPGLADAGSNGLSHLAPQDLDRIMRRVEQEASRMGILVEDMLLLARLDQQRPLDRHTVDLLTLAADAVHDARVVAPSRSINLTVGAGAALLVLGDEVRLRQVIGNLMSNALAHTPDGTPIDVRIRSGSLDEARAAGVATPPGPTPAPLPAPPQPPPSSAAPASPARPRPAPPSSAPPSPPAPAQPAATPASPGWPPAPVPPAAAPPQPGPAPTAKLPASAAVLEVTDHGPGLTSEHAERVFERFYRADQARTTGGTGLGLAIVAALVAAHGGAVWVESAPGAGATFRIALPLAPEALHPDDHEPGDEHDDAGEPDLPDALPPAGGPDAAAPASAPPAGAHPDGAQPDPNAVPRNGAGPGPAGQPGGGPAAEVTSW